MNHIRNVLIILSASLTLYGCTTIIGGHESTAEASGDNMGPATISDTNTTLQNDKFSALTINGMLSATNITIGNDLLVESNATLIKVIVKDDTIIKGQLNATNCSFKDDVKISGNGLFINSYLGGNLEFGGTKLDVSKSSKIIGGIISSNHNLVTITLDHAQIRGDIGFANSNSTLVIKNGGKFTGKLINGNLEKQ